jgi:hypothetical protein
MTLNQLREKWAQAWPKALAAWSEYTRLREPRWCLTKEEEKEQGLAGSFAMIRLEDHAVVVSLRQVEAERLQNFSREILAHEIGHHVYCPANTTDHARGIARIRRALPTIEKHAPLVSNLFTDLLINDKLQRIDRLNMGGVYRTLAKGTASRVWRFYMRIYEILWSLTRGSLAPGKIDDILEGDAQLGARVVRTYARDWVKGAGRFAALCLPYLLEDKENTLFMTLRGWFDTEKAGEGGEPFGVSEMEEDEEGNAAHPAEDEELSGIEGERKEAKASSKSDSAEHRNIMGGKKEDKVFRGPVEYGEILKSIGIDLSEGETAIRYYRERALPYLIRFPVRELPQATEPLPEGTEPWDVGSPLEEIDWTRTVMTSPRVIPGVTTVKQTWGATAGSQPEVQPVDLYVGIDCSGSMPNPKRQLSYPVFAGVIVALSALRAGAKVMACLSGEMGKSIATDGFISGEKEILMLLTDYLGTGTTFGIHRLQPVFENRRPGDRPVHILIVTDNDIFSMLDSKHQDRLGWTVAKTALEKAGGGGTYVLNLPGKWPAKEAERMKSDGWAVHRIFDWEELIKFAREFSQAKYEKKGK